ncbi:MAG: Alpha-galactosidase [Microbacteriaceae bacterium]|jgi:alpha-galactosidase|nr:Alpha-galactosidase [Microbacteriaceae bacterium]
MPETAPVLQLRSGGTGVLVDTRTTGLPTIVHWGRDLGECGEAELAALADAAVPQRVSGSLDTPARLTILPQESFGWQGSPGLVGSRDGRDFSPALETAGIRSTGDSLTVTATDDAARLSATIEVTIGRTGLLRQRITLVNDGESPYSVQHLAPVFPLPSTAAEILDTTGRHLKERSPQRHGFTFGCHSRESRKGRPGSDATVLLAAGSPGFGFERGLVHAVHPEWSGNHRFVAERTSTAESFLSAGELLLAGEVILQPGESYSTPWIVGSWGDGLNELSARFHEELRARPQHPHSPRPVTLNVWEAVYFDHDLEQLSALADRAAEVGVERFVLDDGWFRRRRDDTAGLGDWFVDPEVWPNGLAPLINRVTGHGIQFGLWVEPEMVNPDSDLARTHPDWMLRTETRMPLPARQQQVLNLSVPEAWQYILDRLDAILSENDVSYLKWDHNRDLLDAGDTRTGLPAVHEHTLAVYRLFEQLKLRHPLVEIENCASGGSRVDLAMMRYTDRVWASDCIDPVERLTIQKYTGLLIPLEAMGSHIGGATSHSTGRTHDLDFRAGTAIFGHLGIEWDITAIDADDIRRLAEWVAAYKHYRELLHTGRLLHADVHDPAIDVRGVVAADDSSALFAVSQVTTSVAYTPGRITFPGLDPDRRYTLSPALPSRQLRSAGLSPLRWAERPLTLSGLALATVGIQAPVQLPERVTLIELVTD